MNQRRLPSAVLATKDIFTFSPWYPQNTFLVAVTLNFQIALKEKVLVPLELPNYPESKTIIS